MKGGGREEEGGGWRVVRGKLIVVVQRGKGKRQW